MIKSKNECSSVIFLLCEKKYWKIGTIKSSCFCQDTNWKNEDNGDQIQNLGTQNM